MKLSEIENLVLIGLIGYVLWKVLPKLKQGTDTVSDWVAQFWEWVAFPSAMIPQGNIVLPSGQIVALSDVEVRQMPNGGVAALYGNVVYQLSPSDADGNWPASPL